MTPRIPLYDLAQENRTVAPDLHAGLERAIDSGSFVLGAELEAFETELAGYVGVARCIGLNSGTDALVIGLEALGIGKDDEVVTTPFTFFATVEAILRVGARPVFADIDPDTLCLSAESCAEALSARTRAVLLVHLFGRCGDVDAFGRLCRDRGIPLVEDAAQAVGSAWHGRRLGSFGRLATASFYPTKNLGALGDGGALLTDDPELAAEAARLRSHCHDGDGFRSCGHNSRLDDVQAAFLRAKLAGLDRANARRRALAARYDAALFPQLLVPVPAGCTCNYHQYPVTSARRDALRRHLAAQGIETGLYYRRPVHREPAVSAAGSFPVAEAATGRLLCLPVRPSLTDEQQSRVIAAVNDFEAGRD